MHHKPSAWYNWLWTHVMFTAWSSEVQFMILQGSARPEVRSELYKELKARMTFPPKSAVNGLPAQKETVKLTMIEMFKVCPPFNIFRLTHSRCQRNMWGITSLLILTFELAVMWSIRTLPSAHTIPEEVGHDAHLHYSHMILVCTLCSYEFWRMQFVRVENVCVCELWPNLKLKRRWIM